MKISEGGKKVSIKLHKVSVSVPVPSRPLNGEWTWDEKRGLRKTVENEDKRR